MIKELKYKLVDQKIELDSWIDKRMTKLLHFAHKYYFQLGFGLFVIGYVVFMFCLRGCGMWVDNYQQQEAIKLNYEDICELKTEVIKDINKARENHELPALETDDKLSWYADIRAVELARHFTHNRPNQEKGYTLQQDYEERYMGENIGHNYYTATALIVAWFNQQSGVHNIFREEYTKCGIGCFQDDNGEIYWCMLFSN